MDRISVAGRIRPQSKQEIVDAEDIVLRSENNNISVRTSHAGAPTTKTFKLDCVLPEQSSQVDVFNQVHPLLKSALTGINCSIFAYGQTGTGKTHTMLGYDLWKIAEGDSDDLTSQLACDQRSDDRGIIPRSMEYLFNALRVIKASSSATSALQCAISASYIEIYNEKLIDLLDCSDSSEVQPASTFAPGPASKAASNQKASLEIRNTKTDGVVIPGLTVLEVQSVAEVMECLWIGARKRNVASTNMNDYSSRSHTIFIVKLNFRELKTVNGVRTVTSKASKICFIDLAGSEKWRKVDMSSCSDDRVKELTSINKSLSALGNCISALVALKNDASSPNHAHIPYRDSKLTRLIQDSLGGNTRTFFIVTLSASRTSAEESLSTLQFADRAMKVQIHASANVNVSSGVGNSAASQAAISALQEQVVSLQREHGQVVVRYQTEVVRLRSVLKLLLQNSLTGGGKAGPPNAESSSVAGVPAHLVEEISKYRVPDIDLGGEGNPSSALDKLVGEECVCLSEENTQLRESHQRTASELVASKDEIKRILNIIYSSPAPVQGLPSPDGQAQGLPQVDAIEALSLGPDGQSVGEGGKWQWLNSYHGWLKQQVSDPSKGAPPQANVTKPSTGALTVDTTGGTETDAPVFNESSSDADLYSRIVMMETSVLMQAAELERAKQVFLKLTDAQRDQLHMQRPSSAANADDVLLSLPADTSIDAGQNPEEEAKDEGAVTYASASPQTLPPAADSSDDQCVFLPHPQGAVPTPVINRNARSRLPVYDPSTHRSRADMDAALGQGPTLRASLSDLSSATENDNAGTSLETDLLQMLAEEEGSADADAGGEGDIEKEQKKEQAPATPSNPSDLLKLASTICIKHKAPGDEMGADGTGDATPGKTVPSRTPMRKKTSNGSAGGSSAANIYSTPAPTIIKPAGRTPVTGVVRTASRGVAPHSAPKPTKSAQVAQVAVLAESRNSLGRARVPGSTSKSKITTGSLGPKKLKSDNTTLSTKVKSKSGGVKGVSKGNGVAKTTIRSGGDIAEQCFTTGEVEGPNLGGLATSFDSLTPSSYCGSDEGSYPYEGSDGYDQGSDIDGGGGGDDDSSAASDELAGELSQTELIKMANSIFERQTGPIPAQMVQDNVGLAAGSSLVQDNVGLAAGSSLAEEATQLPIKYKSSTKPVLNEIKSPESGSGAVTQDAPANLFAYKINKSTRSVGSASSSSLKRVNVGDNSVISSVTVNRRQSHAPKDHHSEEQSTATKLVRFVEAPLVSPAVSSQPYLSTNPVSSIPDVSTVKTYSGASKKKGKTKTVWKEFFDADSSSKYYYNRVTKETTWDRPSDVELAMEYQ